LKGDVGIIGEQGDKGKIGAKGILGIKGVCSSFYFKNDVMFSFL